jgi:D-glycero-alpha-D-manno-heptose 1-phosphate guanylyltransferase
MLGTGTHAPSSSRRLTTVRPLGMLIPVIPQAVILLGGQGTRLAARFPDLPKALVPVHGRPFLEWQLDWLRRGGSTQVLLAAGHKADVLEKYLAARKADGLSIVLSREPEPRGTGGALKFVEKQISTDLFLVLNGDSLTPNLDFSTVWKTFFHCVEKSGNVFPQCGTVEYRAQADRRGANARSMAPRSCAASEGANATAAAKLFVTPIAEAGRYGTVEFGADGFVTAFREKAERANGFVNTGIYLLPRALLAAIPEEKAVSIETEIFPALAAQRQLIAIPAPPPLLDMGTPDGLAAMENFLRG